jgi:hypothetical protein
MALAVHHMLVMEVLEVLVVVAAPVLLLELLVEVASMLVTMVVPAILVVLLVPIQVQAVVVVLKLRMVVLVVVASSLLPYHLATRSIKYNNIHARYLKWQLYTLITHLPHPPHHC